MRLTWSLATLDRARLSGQATRPGAGASCPAADAARSVIDAAALLAAYDEVHARPRPVPPRGRAERDGPLVRTTGWPRGGLIEYRDLGGLEGAALDELIARQVRIFSERGESFEWKTHGHDLAADLSDRLRAAGFVPEPQETVLVAPSSAIAREPVLPAGCRPLREVSEVADFERIAELGAVASGAGARDWLVEMLAGAPRVDPRSR